MLRIYIFVPAMKKALASILLLFYLTFTTGVIINMHYCMNRFDSAKLGSAQTEICGKCGMHTSDANGCCHDDIKIFRIDDSHQAPAVFAGLYPVPVPALSSFIENETTVYTGFSTDKYSDHSPPLQQQDTYLWNCVFRI